MTTDEAIKKLLSELIDAWSERYTPEQIGSQPDKIRLLLAVHEVVTKPPEEKVCRFYEKVFLRNVWSEQGLHKPG